VTARRAVGLLQWVELAIALGLAWVGFHAPSVAPELLGSAGAIVVWAVIADGPLGVARWVGLPAHRRGLMGLAGIVMVLPFLAGRWSDLALVVPCVAGGAILLRMGLVRWPGITEEPDRLPPPSRLERLGRDVGRATGREVNVRLPRRARRAGQAVGRAWQGRNSGRG
jgi:hypothetical protein